MAVVEPRKTEGWLYFFLSKGWLYREPKLAQSVPLGQETGPTHSPKSFSFIYVLNFEKLKQGKKEKDNGNN
jgi:hypothetical protein